MCMKLGKKLFRKNHNRLVMKQKQDHTGEANTVDAGGSQSTGIAARSAACGDKFSVFSLNNCPQTQKISSLKKVFKRRKQ